MESEGYGTIKRTVVPHVGFWDGKGPSGEHVGIKNGL